MASRRPTISSARPAITRRPARVSQPTNWPTAPAVAAPPKKPWRSNSTVRAPWRAAAMAATVPAMPPPLATTSQSMGFIFETDHTPGQGRTGGIGVSAGFDAPRSAGRNGGAFHRAVARAQDLTKASIALLRLSSSGPIFIAQEKGWFKEAGLDLTMKDFQAAAQVPLAVVSGDADLGVTAFTAGFFNLAAKGGLKVVAAQSAERPGYQLNVIAVTNPAWEQGVRSSRISPASGSPSPRSAPRCTIRWRSWRASTASTPRASPSWPCSRSPTWWRPSRAARSTPRCFPSRPSARSSRRAAASRSPMSATRCRGSSARSSPRPRPSPSAGRWSRSSSSAIAAARPPITRPSASATTASWCRARTTTR